MAAAALCGHALAAAAPAAAQRLPRQDERPAAIAGVVRDQEGRPLAAVTVTLHDREDRRTTATTTGDGVFRLRDVRPGVYELRLEREGYEPLARPDIPVRPGQVLTLELVLRARAAPPPPPPPPTTLPERPGAPPAPPVDVAPAPPYRELPRPVEEPEAAAEPLPPAEKVFLPVPDRWRIVMPDWDRYGTGGDYPYVGRRWWDPYNRSPLKGDYPIIGDRIFFAFTGISDTLFEARNVPTPSSPSAARPDSEDFFGRGGQVFPVPVFRFTFDLFRGAAAFRPVDWRIRVQPAVSLNYLHTQERGVVNPDVRRGRDRFDRHIGLQEAFAEVKLADLSVNYDFLSVRAGIQEFSSDFRGLLAVLEQPGVRVFGTLRSNRLEYNFAVFDLLEKDTNSVFNTLERRTQQVVVANLYVQDFIREGYTTQVSYHYNKDDAAFHHDTNGFLVRPMPVGLIVPHDVRAHYLGWAGNGHFGRLNISHAFYQAFGYDEFNPIAARRVDINAQMAALELSVDFDWMRVRGAALFASGDGDLDDDTARGFDAIIDIPVFAGGPFSLWNREALRLPMTLTGFVSPLSVLPSLRTNKDEGQPNFVNPGLLLVNGALDVEVTPKLKAFANLNALRFHRTESLEALLFQAPIRPNIGLDYGVGFLYRPPLTENIVLIGGVSGLRFGQGGRDIFTRNHVVSVFTNLRLQF